MAEENNQAQTPPRDIGKILQLVAAVFVFLVTGGGAYLVYASTLGWENPKITEDQLERELASMSKEIKEPFIYTMDPFTVNLAGEPRRAIKIEVNLEMLGKEGFEEVINVENRAKARDRIVRILNDKTFSELETIQGKLFLKQSIALEINNILKKGIVKDIYFSEFVVQ